MDNRIRVWVQIGTDQPFPTTLEDFATANDGDSEAAEAVAAVQAGKGYTGGGGAAPLWSIAPGERLVDAMTVMSRGVAA